MLMVVILHVLGHGGILDATVPMTTKHYTAWLLETFAYCAVNCYALITGYVYIDSKHKYSSFVTIWLQAFLYSAGISICVWLLRPDLFSLAGFLDAFFPVSRGTYWYLSSYACLFIVIPFINAAINTLTKKKTKVILLLSTIVMSVLPTLLRRDPATTNSGYSMAWLGYMYLLGACIKKYGWGTNLSVKKNLLLYTACAILSWGAKIIIDILTNRLLGELKGGNIFISYTSPTIVAAAVFLFLAFRKLPINERFSRFIAVFSPSAFGVYLIHEQGHVKGHFINDAFSFAANWHPAFMVFGVIGIACIIFSICIAIDYVRHRFFVKLKLKERIEGLERKSFIAAKE